MKENKENLKKDKPANTPQPWKADNKEFSELVTQLWEHFENEGKKIPRDLGAGAAVKKNNKKKSADANKKGGQENKKNEYLSPDNNFEKMKTENNKKNISEKYPENGKKDELKVSFVDFGSKYRDFYRKNVFSGFDEKERIPKGNWIHIVRYNRENETAECYFGGVGNEERFEEKKEIELDKLDEILKEYTYDKDGNSVGIKKNPEKKEKKQHKNFVKAEKQGAGQERNKKESETELKDFENWGSQYWAEVEKEVEWKGYDSGQKKESLKIMTEVFLKELIEEQAGFIKKSEAKKISKEIVKKIMRK